ncbi:heparinase II/III domain-containing protein [Dyadobacter aurulentus]|uniref:heparinase II/III domain-containing protein n=1 Tax=Dyadobacter sp. UC 10 TaxID=2605428 RepID=UPI0011F0BFFE|nr:heparinase II/III family protein [Dyadobacter sp. UC 10]KAA0988780.1 hypothetical protein FXO21_00665 [Dyadobacter sp. UC 10]
MHIFITKKEREDILQKLHDRDPLICSFLDALKQRVARRVENGGLCQPGDATSWYYPAAEYISDAAMLHGLFPEEKRAAWIRSVTLTIARKPESDWAGPAFRNHSKPYSGHLETAHLCWALASALDLAGDVWSEAERDEIETALAEKGMELCERWVQKNTHLANWRGIMVSGVIVSSAVLRDEEILDAYIPELQQCATAFQSDGSYAESLQYGNYLAFALMLAYESVARAYPAKAAQLDVSAYGKGIKWVVNSMLYAKPMNSWGEQPRARAVNFNDSAALFRPSGDLLLHLAARNTNREEAGLAFYLFQKYYQPVPYQGPHDLATFGMRNDWGFLTLPLLTNDLQAVTPQEANLPATVSFSNGHGFLRDQWDGKAVVAINGGGDALNGPGHLHGDVNGFILAYQHERLLVDPGHSCYRNLIHGLESASQTHNTCTFLVEKDKLGLQEDLAKATLLEQKSVLPRREIRNGKVGEPVDRGNRKLICERSGIVSVIGCEAAKVYDDPITTFSRFWILAGSQVVFVVDKITANKPVTTMWNWLVNNRDGKTTFEKDDHALAVRRGGSGMRLFQSAQSTLGFPVYAYVHDAYHVEPNQLGEGKPGSGLLFRHTENESTLDRIMVTAIALDQSENIALWNYEAQGNTHILRKGNDTWELEVAGGFERINVVGAGGRIGIIREDGGWRMEEG